MTYMKLGERAQEQAWCALDDALVAGTGTDALIAKMTDAPPLTTQLSDVFECVRLSPRITPMAIAKELETHYHHVEKLVKQGIRSGVLAIFEKSTGFEEGNLLHIRNVIDVT